MAGTQWPFLAAVLLLLSSNLPRSSSSPTCPQSCTCQTATLLNCSSSGLSSVPQLIQDSVTELDLSHNLLDSVTLHRPHRNLRNVRLGNNTITHLSLCMERNLDGKYLRGRRRLRPWSRGGCVSWAPSLQLLSVERNLLEQLPDGLDGVESLQVLQLSFNRISTLQPEDLRHLQQLKELDLKHNLITSLHPQMFQDLVQLKVLDLSFNMMTSLNPLTYFTLHNIGADVTLGGNRWNCDCSMRSLRRRMAYDSSRGLPTWKMVCAFPSTLSGRDLLQLEEDELNCFSTEISPELHRDVMVYSGSEILLSCSAEDSVWWTPNGQASVSHNQAGLLISDITERDTGLYVCVSEENQVVSVYNLQISHIGGAKRKPRSVTDISRQIIPQGTINMIGELRNQNTTQSDLALAVCLSILFTFLIAFILGVLARPCIDGFWKRVTTKKRSTETHVGSSVEQRQYDNEAYSIGEEQEAVEPFRERRVTFDSVVYREENNVKYYDTVASGNQGSIDNDEVFDGEAAEAERVKRTAGDSASESSSLQSIQEDKRSDGRDLSGEVSAGRTHKMEFERIPDPSELEERRSRSSSSDSSLSENEVGHTTPKSPQIAVETLHQKSDLPTTGKVEVPQISIEGRSEIHGFPSEPFADWSPHTNSADLGVLQENEELFEFSDSVQSTSARSSSAFDSFNDPEPTVAPTSDKQKEDNTSSSSSSSSSNASEDEPYTVNLDHKAEQDASSKLQINSVHQTMPSVVFNKGDNRHDTKKPAPRPDHSLPSDSSGSDDKSVQREKDVTVKIKPMPRTKWRGVGLSVASVSKGVAPSPPTRHSSSSSSESEAEVTDLKGKHSEGRVNQNKMTWDTSAPLPASGSSSSSDSEEERKKRGKWEQKDVHMSRPPIKVSQTLSHKHETWRPALDLEHTTSIKRHPDIKAPSASSDSSSSSDSESETTGHTSKQRQGKLNTTGQSLQRSQTKSHDPDAKWPGLDLGHIPRIKRRLDIKAPSPASDSSTTSDSEEETTHKKKQEQEELHLSRPSNKLSKTVSHEPDTQWPLLDLERTTSTKRRLDIKAPSASSDSSSSSDSEDETTGHTEKQRPEKLNTAGVPLLGSQTKSQDPDAKWPGLDLQHIPRIKRRLDIKAPSPASDSSSSSDSEDERKKSIKKQKQKELYISRPSIKVSQTVSREPETWRPALDLEHTTSIKRHPGIKAPSASSDSYSSSDSESETKGHTELNTTEVPLLGFKTKSHDPDAKWPSLDLGHIPHIKRRLDIKAPTVPSDSSSSSDSEDESKISIKKQEQEKLYISRPSIKVSQTVSQEPDTQWPLLDLERTTSTKRRLDIKELSASSDSSSSCDSEEEKKGHTEMQRPGKLNTTEVPLLGPQTKSHAPDAKWPGLDLQHIPRIKRRIDIKAPSPASDSSSSSDSEEETGHTEKQRPGKLNTTEVPLKGSQTKIQDPEKQWPGLDLGHIPRIKRRLDIKAPSPVSDSSSNIDSEEETTHIKKQEQGDLHPSRLPNTVSPTVSHEQETRRPAIDLEHTTSIKRYPDIKAPSASSDSSSSSDSEEEIGHTEKQRPEKLNALGQSLQGSQTKSHDADAKWPGLDLQHIPRIKRRLDIKAPSPASDSSSSSDSEDESKTSIKKQEQEKLYISRPSNKVSQTVSQEPDTQWPLLDLELTISTKRRLDIKALSASSDSSSSCDSEEETGHTEKQRPGKLNTTGQSLQRSQTKSHDPDAKWPGLDLQQIPRIKRRLDIKAPSTASDSSSSSDSEEETTHRKKHEKKELHLSRPPNKVSPVVSFERETQRPLLDLERTTSTKRRLDIKAPSASSDSLSSSESENETTGHTEKQRPGKWNITEVLLLGSQTKSPDQDAKWPGLDLQHIPRIKTRLDIKAPSTTSDSSTSSDSEEETTHIKKQEQEELHLSRPPNKLSQTVSHEPDTQWPLLDLELTTSMKRRLDFKAPSASSKSSSSSDSENETTGHTEKQRPRKLNTTEVPLQGSQTKSHDTDAKWPGLDLGHIPRIKRRLDIKAPSPASDSSSSSDSEEETTHIKKHEQGELYISRPSIKVSQTVNLEPETQRPLLDLERTTSTNRRLDIEAPSASSDSSSSSESENETTGHTEKQRPGKLYTTEVPLKGSQTKSHDPDAKWPGLDLQRIPRIKRCLDIKAPSPASDSSISSDSEEETKKYIKKHEPEELYISRPSIKVSKTVSHEPKTQWPLLDLEDTTSTKRRLDIKAPSASSDSFSSSDSEEETKGHTEMQRPGKLNTTEVPLLGPQTKSHAPDAKWPGLDLQHIPRIKRRIDIKAPSPASDSSSSSDSEAETTDHTEKQRPGKLDIAELPFKQSPTLSQDTQRPAVDIGNITYKRRLDIKAPPAQPDLGLNSVSLGSQKSESNSFTSDSEDEKRDQKFKVGMGVSVTPVSEKDLINFPKTPLRTIFHSPKTEPNIKLIKYTDFSDDVGNKPPNDNIYKTSVITPELQSRWAEMNLSLSRSRKRLESTTQRQKSSDLPSSPLPDSPSYSGESGPGSQISRTRLRRKDVGITVTGSSLIHDNKPMNASPTLKDQSDTIFDFGPPHNKKYLDIKGSEKASATTLQQQPDSSSSSNTEDETVQHKAPDLSLGIPHIKRRLNIKAPSPEPSSSSSSSSESEKEVQKYTEKQSRYASNMTDSDSAITYKRVIIKTSSLPGNSLSPTGKSQTADHTDAPTSWRTAPSMSFDDMVQRRIQQSRRKTDLDLPPELMWTGIGHHLSDLSTSTPNLNTVSMQPASPAQPKLPPAYPSGSKSDIKIKQDSGKTDATVVHKHSSLSAAPVSSTSRGALHKLMNLPSNTYETSRAATGDGRERKGLSALKSMAFERQKWEAEDLNKGTFSLLDNNSQQSDTSFDYHRSEADIKVLSRQMVTHLSSASIIERRATDGVSHYRSHNVREPSQAAPPALPVTPPPSYEAAGLTWRSPQSTQKQAWEGNPSYQQQRKSSEGSGTSSENSNSLNFDYSNAISRV